MNKEKHTTPKLDWKTTTCVVCGKPVDYISKQRPKTCRGGECEYKFHYKIDPKKWATYQPNLFD